MRVFLGLLLASLSFTSIAATPKDVVGQYRLVGVMETASALELFDDQRFRWFLSVGSLDVEVAGTWERQHDTVVLTADGAEETLAKAIRLQRTSSAREWLPKLPPDHPLHDDPRVVSVRLVAEEDGSVGGALAYMMSSGNPVESTQEWQDANERWFVAKPSPGQSVDELWVGVWSGGGDAPAVSREFPVSLMHGDVAEISISMAGLEGDPKFIRQPLQVNPDGTLTPGELWPGDADARYVRD